MSRTTHAEFKKRALSNPKVKAEYDKLEVEFSLINELIHARKMADKTQEEVAQAMNTTKSAVSRLESGGGVKQHMPSLTTIRRYAEAVGCKLQIKLVPKKKSA